MIRTGLFVILGHFLPFYPPNNLENQNSEKNRKNIWTCHHFTHLYQKSWSYNLCFMRYRMWQTTFLSFWAIFCFSTLLMTQKIKTWEKKKKKKTPEDIILYVYHKWRSYDVWFLKYKVWWTEFSTVLAIFCPFTPLTTQKVKILKKWKKHLEILSFHNCVPQMTIMILWFLRYGALPTP